MDTVRQPLPLWAPLLGAVAGLAALLPFHIAIGANMGWHQAQDSGQVGWAILTVPAGPIMLLLLGVPRILPHLVAIVAVWIFATMLLGRWLLLGKDRLQGALFGILIGLPGTLAAVGMSAGRTEDVAEDLFLAFPLPLLFGAFSLIACAVAGATVASIARNRARTA